LGQSLQLELQVRPELVLVHSFRPLPFLQEKGWVALFCAQLQLFLVLGERSENAQHSYSQVDLAVTFLVRSLHLHLLSIY